MRQIFYKNENILVEVEAVGDTMYLHCLITNWKLSVLKQLYFLFATMKETFRSAGFERMATITPNPKFAKMFGGETIKEFNYSGKPCEVIVWVLTP